MFKAEIIESSKELTPRERVALKDTGLCHRLDEIVPNPGEGDIKLAPLSFVLLHITNDKAKDGNTEYDQFVIVASDGERYLTGSESFITSFRDIWEEMDGFDENDPWILSIYKKESKNRAGKYFLTCSLVMD